MSKSPWAVVLICCVAGCSEPAESGRRDAEPARSDAGDVGAAPASGGSTSAQGSGGAAGGSGGMGAGSGGAIVGIGGSSGMGGVAGADASTIRSDGSPDSVDASRFGGSFGRDGGFGTGGSTRGTGGSQATGGTANTGGSKATGGTTGTGGATARGGSTGAGGTGGGSGCYAEPAKQIGTQAPGGTVSDYGTVMIWAKSPRQIVRLQTKMVVPPKPPASGTLFLWPGIQPDGVNFEPIDNGVLQPVLTWGPSCAPGKQPRSYSTWWISGQYVNTNGKVSGYTGCDGGTIMSVEVCDTLDIDMALSGTIWTQTITDVETNQTVSYSLDMKDQAQNLAYFVIEEYSSAPVSEVIFTDTILTFDSADATDCKVSTRGQSDYVSSPAASSDGLQCSIQQMILRAKGIP